MTACENRLHRAQLSQHASGAISSPLAPSLAPAKIAPPQIAQTPKEKLLAMNEKQKDLTRNITNLQSALQTLEAKRPHIVTKLSDQGATPASRAAAVQEHSSLNGALKQTRQRLETCESELYHLKHDMDHLRRQALDAAKHKLSSVESMIDAYRADAEHVQSDQKKASENLIKSASDASENYEENSKKVRSFNAEIDDLSKRFNAIALTLAEKNKEKSQLAELVAFLDNYQSIQVLEKDAYKKVMNESVPYKVVSHRVMGTSVQFTIENLSKTPCRYLVVTYTNNQGRVNLVAIPGESLQDPAELIFSKGGMVSSRGDLDPSIELFVHGDSARFCKF